MKKFVKLRYKVYPKPGEVKVKEFIINRNTINRIVEKQRIIIVSTPVFPKGYKNQAFKLDEKDFKYLMEQINVD